MSKFKLPEKPVEDDWKKELILDCDVNLSVLERLKLFFGYKLKVRARVKCLNSPGRVETKWLLKVYDPSKANRNEPSNQ